MLRLLTRTLRSSFALQPQRSNRYFSLRVELKQELPLSQTILQEHQKHLENSQERGEVLFAGRQKDKNIFEYLFQSPNEIEPFTFVKKSPFQLHKMIVDYHITEIQLQLKVKDKELAPDYLRQ